jgi:hypothetical protein
MDPADDKVNFRGTAFRASSRPIRLAGSVLGHPRHICAFFNSHDDEYRVLLPFIKDGLESGEKAVHTVDPERCDDHLRRLEAAGIDVSTTRQHGQLELCSWSDTHLRDGDFDQHKTLALFADIVKKAKGQGFPLIRFVTHMEWALGNRSGVDVLSSLYAKPEE